jgi:Ca2+-binding RTX toxin-like protein
MDAPVPGSEQDTAGGPPADDPVLILDRDSVLRISDESDILRIDGGSDDVVHAIGDWQRSGDKSIEGRTYVRYELDGATLLVAQAITVEIAEPSQNANVPSPPPGTPHADDLTGTDGDDVFFAGAGDDTVSGGGGTDLLFGQADNDLIDGGDGDDMLSGGEGNDEIYSGDGFDRIDGGAGDDVIWANTMRTGFAELGRSPDHVSGGSGNDTIAMAAIGGESPVPLIADGGSGDDIINGGNADDVLFGGSGNDRIVGVEGNDFIDGGDGDDELIWTGGIAPTGEAAMFGGDGDDRLSGGTSNAAVMDGGNGSDVIVAGVFAAPGGLEAFDGGAGFDTLDLRLRLVQSETIDLTDPEGFGGALSGFERIDMGVPMSANDAEAAPVDDPVLIVDRESVLRMSDETDTLVVDGGSDDQVRAIGNWQRAGEVYGDDRAFVRYELGDAVLLIASDIATSVEADLCGCG